MDTFDKTETIAAMARFRNRLADLTMQWKKSGLPAGGVLEAEAQTLESWKTEKGITGLWDPSPLMVTATLDDGIGQGLRIINKWAEVAGMRVHFLGLMKTPGQIISACHDLQPELLGMTVLQFDTEPELAGIRRDLPDHTRFIAGGPVFKGDAELAERAGIDFVARDLVDFLSYVLER